MHVQMHVHTGIINKAASVHSKHDNQDDDKMSTLTFISFYSSKFSQPWFIAIFHRQNFDLYGNHKSMQCLQCT